MFIEPGQLNFFGNQLFQQSANEAIVLVPDAPGLEYTLRKNKMHYDMPDSLMHSTLRLNRMHYDMPDED